MLTLSVEQLGTAAAAGLALVDCIKAYLQLAQQPSPSMRYSEAWDRQLASFFCIVVIWKLTRNIPHWFVPLKWVIDSPNKFDLDIAELNFWASMLTMVGSMWPDLVKTSAQVAAGSQQFDNLGLYRLSEKSNLTALAIIVLIPPLSAIADWLTLLVQKLRGFWRQLLGWVSL